MSKRLVNAEPNNFMLIRLAMALLVVWSHSFALYFGSEATEPISKLTDGVFNAGNLGVLVFFMVSGFLISQSFDRSRSALRYLKKRVARIYPGYLVATCLCAFVLLPCYAGVSYTIGSAAKTVSLNLLLRNFFVNTHPFTGNPNPAIDGSLWSIPFEFWCYLGVMVIGVARLLGRRSLVLGLYILAIATHAWVEYTGRRPGGGVIGVIIGWPYEWLKVFPCFMAGMLLYLYRDTVPRNRYLATVPLLIMIAAVHLPFARTTKLTIDAALFPSVVGYVVFYVAFSKQRLDIRADCSYGTYLYAFPIQQLLVATFTLSFSEFVICSILLSLLAGTLSWYCVERWFHRPSRSQATLTAFNPQSAFS